MKIKLLALLLLIAVSVNACAPAEAAIEIPPTSIPTKEPISAASPIDTTSQPEIPVTSVWRAVRDPRYGFGFAIPCWWQTNSITTDNGLYTVRNYDDSYFSANSTKGFWDWPHGTLKLDVVIFEGVDPVLSDADVFMQQSDPTMTGFVSSEQRQYGAYPASVVTVSNLNNTSEPDTQLFFFRFAPDKLLMINPIPQSIIETPDFQALLSSIVLSPEEQISLPVITPASALIDASCAQ